MQMAQPNQTCLHVRTHAAAQSSLRITMVMHCHAAKQSHLYKGDNIIGHVLLGQDEAASALADSGPPKAGGIVGKDADASVSEPGKGWCNAA